MAKFIVIHEHTHGTTSYLVEYEKEPTISQLVRCLDLDFEPSKDEGLTVGVVNDNEPTILDWQDSDAEDYDEFSDDAEEARTNRAVNAAVSSLELVVDDEDDEE
jgi:hypothetical protein